jgi:hypothetical protein
MARKTTHTQKKNYSNSCALNKTLLKGQWVIEEIKKETKKFFDSNENEDTNSRTCGTWGETWQGCKDGTTYANQ